MKNCCGRSANFIKTFQFALHNSKLRVSYLTRFHFSPWESASNHTLWLLIVWNHECVVFYLLGHFWDFRRQTFKYFSDGLPTIRFTYNENATVFYFLALYHVHQIKQHALIYKFFYFLRNLIGFFTFFKTNFRLGIKISRQKMQIYFFIEKSQLSPLWKKRIS